jgi:CubicO group peptidase (beta-lactamase class C family)
MTRTVFVLFPIFFFLFACQQKNEKLDSNKKKATVFKIPEFYFTDTTIFPTISANFKKEKNQEIEDFVKNSMDLSSFNGSILVAKNGQVIYEKYQGYSNYSKRTKINSNTGLHLASVGKVLTAAAIFRLIEEGKLNLDQKVISVLKKFPYPQITIRMLLNHRSGIAKYSNFTEPDNIWGVTKTLHNSAILKILSKKKIPLDFLPDTKFTYCNTNYAVLASIIETVTKHAFPKAMQLVVFEPLGMKNSFVFELRKQKNRVSQSYYSDFRVVPFDHLDAVYGDKNIYSTPRDLLRYDLAMYNDDFISAKLKKEIYKGYSYEKQGIKNYGLGIRLKEWENGQQLFYHNGWWHGNTSCYATLKKEKITIIALSNKFSKKVYDAIRISSLFGDYLNEIEDN